MQSGSHLNLDSAYNLYVISCVFIIFIMSIYINNTGRPLYIVEGIIIVEAASRVSQIDIDGKNGTYIIRYLCHPTSL